MHSKPQKVPARAIEYLIAKGNASAPFTEDGQAVSRIVPWEGGFALVSTDGSGWRLVRRQRSIAVPRGARLISRSEAQQMLESRSPASRAKHQARAAKLAAAGRGGDTEVAHVTPGEMVLHPSQLSPETLAAVVRDLAPRGIGLGQVSVGSPDVRRNPRSGAAEFDPTSPPSEPGRPTYWVQEPDEYALIPGIARPIPMDGPATGLISDLNVARPDLSAPSTNWGNFSDPYGAWGRASQGTGPMQIGRMTPISDAAAAGGLISYRQNNLPDGWTATTFGAPRDEHGAVVVLQEGNNLQDSGGARANDGPIYAMPWGTVLRTNSNGEIEPLSDIDPDLYRDEFKKMSTENLRTAIKELEDFQSLAEDGGYLAAAVGAAEVIAERWPVAGAAFGFFANLGELGLKHVIQFGKDELGARSPNPG